MCFVRCIRSYGGLLIHYYIIYNKDVKDSCASEALQHIAKFRSNNIYFIYYDMSLNACFALSYLQKLSLTIKEQDIIVVVIYNY